MVCSIGHFLRPCRFHPRFAHLAGAGLGRAAWRGASAGLRCRGAWPAARYLTVGIMGKIGTVGIIGSIGATGTIGTTGTTSTTGTTGTIGSIGAIGTIGHHWHQWHQ